MHKAANTCRGSSSEITWHINYGRNIASQVSVTVFSLSNLLQFLAVDAPFHQVSVLFAKWYQIRELPGTNDAACARYILHLLQRGLLKGDDMSDRLFSRLMVLAMTLKFIQKDAEEKRTSFNPRPYFRLFIN
ncbi:CCR4-NOT transcription complex subunit 1-like [Forsythia ovata]|uniref:CCR4-NOT transcription complex subunit 1-like n=1 Tax=Forsythia ovata TaxID=205694 RepID=A0ABD1X968_9LAMI